MARLVLGSDINNSGVPSVVKKSGITPTGTINITQNSLVDVTQYANANVDVPPEYLGLIEVANVDATGKVISNSTTLKSIGITDVSAGLFNNKYQNSIGLSSSIVNIDLSSLIAISEQNACQNMFSGCSNITNFDLSSLTTISGQNACTGMFYDCDGLISVDLSSLTTISGQSGCYRMFAGCSNLTSVNLDSLEVISGDGGCHSMFSGCSKLTTLSFPSLKTVYNANVFMEMLGNRDHKVATVHFPSNFSTVVTGSDFGDNKVTVLYDLPATE